MTRRESVFNGEGARPTAFFYNGEADRWSRSAVHDGERRKWRATEVCVSGEQGVGGGRVLVDGVRVKEREAKGRR
jgi:hypothetical protein